MSKAIETLTGDDAIAFQGAISPHVDAIADTLGLSRLADLASSASGNGASLIRLRSGRTVESKLRETISVADFGAIGDALAHTVAEWIIPGALGRYPSLAALQVDYPHVTATTNCLNWAAFQAAVNYGMNLGLAGGCTITVPPGQFDITGSIKNDRSANSALGVVDFAGAGRRATWIMHHYAGALFWAKGHPTEVGKQTTDLSYTGMTLLGDKLPGQCAFQTYLCSDPHYEDLHIEGFDYGFDLEDVDQAVFSACMLQFNRRHIRAQQKAAPVSNSTQPNQFSFIGVSLLTSELYAIYCKGGSNWTYIGGVVANNGLSDDVGGFGVMFEDCGYQGGNICLFLGTNFESNNGVADVWLKAMTSSSGLTQATYALPWCSFNRTSNTMKTVNSIRTDFASVATVGEQLVNIDGSVFKSLGEYTPSGSRPYLNWAGAQARTPRNCSTDGAVFEDGVEAPPYIQNLGKPFVRVSKSANQTIANVTPTIWQIDTIDKGFGWGGTINPSYEMTIAESGFYAISAHHIFTTTPAGTPRIEILLNGTMAIGSNGTGSIDSVSASAMEWLNAGDRISVRSTQNSGGSITLAGSSSSRSCLAIMKLVDA